MNPIRNQISTQNQTCTIRLATARETGVAVSIDDDACQIFDETGLDFDLPPAHASFMQAEQTHWAATAAEGRMYFAVVEDKPVGFVALGLADGSPHIEQLSVRQAYMRRGIGSALMKHALELSADAGVLWLTTYDHVPWNAPFYESHGFIRVGEEECGPQLREILRRERQALPAPEHRIVMAFRHH